MYSGLKKKKCIIVIPIHSAEPSPAELLSFKQCFKILHKHQITVLAPDNLDLMRYKSVVSAFEVLYIDPSWQSSVRQYNRLKISTYFYDTFKKYDYLLTYELDAFVFRDELHYWCSKEFDYIGAPWFEGWTLKDSIEIKGVGNSGFSLRKIKSASKMLHSLRYATVLDFYKYYVTKSIIVRLPKILYQLYKSRKIMSGFEESYFHHEDRFWCMDAPEQIQNSTYNNFVLNILASILLKKNFKIAEVNQAIKFAFEVNPRKLYEMNNKNLPFGCHAWEKYEPEFWVPFIH